MSAKKPFTPPQLPIEVDYLALTRYLADAHRALASLDATLRHTPSRRLFERTFTTKEAVLSSRIEGTVASLSEVLAFEAENIETDHRRINDIREVLNYRAALEYGVDHLKKDDPITENFVKKLHGILLREARGRNRTPGEFRKIQVYIGSPGARIEDAVYMPPEPQNIVACFSNLEKYINDLSEKDPLVKIALTHYQFEAIHPFVDGNGRVGRLLIMLQLLKEDMLTHPFLYLSEYFEANRRDYYATLNDVSTAGAYTEWIRFFLTGLKEQAKRVEQSALDIIKLHENYKSKVAVTNSRYAQSMLEAMFRHPVFDAALMRKAAGIRNSKTVHNLINKFAELGFIRPLNPNAQRGKLYAFTELLQLNRGDD